MPRGQRPARLNILDILLLVPVVATIVLWKVSAESRVLLAVIVASLLVWFIASAIQTQLDLTRPKYPVPASPEALPWPPIFDQHSIGCFNAATHEAVMVPWLLVQQIDVCKEADRLELSITAEFHFLQFELDEPGAGYVLHELQLGLDGFDSRSAASNIASLESGGKPVRIFITRSYAEDIGDQPE